MIQDTINRVLPELRREAEARMLSRCTVYRKAAPSDAKDEHGFSTDNTWTTVHTDLPVSLGGSSGSDGGSREITIGGVHFEQATGVAKFPATTVDLKDDDLFEITDGEWPGHVFRIVAAIVADQKTSRRVPIAEAARPPEWA